MLRSFFGKERALFKRALVRPPGLGFERGLTTAGLGPPVLEKALEQHERYCQTLERCGLELTRLDPDPRFPDSTFVEDTAVLAAGCAVVTRPGAQSRRGEVESVREALEPFFDAFHEITAPGTLDGGDVCEAEDHFFIGISERTNEEGARQLSRFLAEDGYSSTLVDVRGVEGLLHLKSGMASLGRNRLAAIDALALHPALHSFEIVRVEPEEAYAANLVLVNDTVLLAAGFPAMLSSLRALDYSVVTLDMSEYRAMDGGLSCLSLRF
jgi:dimethylargininase